MTRLPLLLTLQDAAPAVVPADTAWMLVSTALVLLMTPALAFFYGGLVRSKNSLNTMMMSFAALGVVGIVWALLAYSLAFAEGNAWIGGVTNDGTEREVHVAFEAKDRDTVVAFFEAAVAAGAEVLHEPREWPEYHAGYFGAFVRDLDGNNVEAVCHS